MSKVIRKISKDREKELMDEFLTQLQNEPPLSEPDPLEITQDVKDRMSLLMENYLANKDKLSKLNAIKREIMSQTVTITKDLRTLMKLYGLNELIKGQHKFCLEQTTRKNTLIAKNKRSDIKEVLAMVVNDPETLNKACALLDSATKDTTSEKFQCIEYDGH